MARVPIGIEKVLCRAAGDDDFRRRLFSHREETLASLGETISPGERGVLESIPDASLRTMVGNIDLKKHPRRRFMKAVVAATFVTAAATTAVGCFMPVSTGAGPDYPDTRYEEDHGAGDGRTGEVEKEGEDGDIEGSENKR